MRNESLHEPIPSTSRYDVVTTPPQRKEEQHL